MVLIIAAERQNSTGPVCCGGVWWLARKSCLLFPSIASQSKRGRLLAIWKWKSMWRRELAPFVDRPGTWYTEPRQDTLICKQRAAQCTIKPAGAVRGHHRCCTQSQQIPRSAATPVKSSLITKKCSRSLLTPGANGSKVYSDGGYDTSLFGLVSHEFTSE